MLRNIAVLTCLSFSVSCASTGLPVRTPVNHVISVVEVAGGAEEQEIKRMLRVLTLNIAHGRNAAVNQLLVSKETHRENLLQIAHLLQEHEVDIVALQEADGPSRWSGQFDHVEFIARQAQYPWHTRAEHANSWLFNYGTAILSRLPILEAHAHTFKPTPPTLNKGFLLSEIAWKLDAENTIAIDVISVHLDFSRESARKQQIAELADTIAERGNPLIILGDFNSDWFAKASVVRALAEEGNVKVYHPEADNLNTYNANRRLDWILISDDLQFIEYRVLPDVVSDHLAVIAEIILAPSRNAGVD